MKKYIPNLFVAIIILYLLTLIKPAIFGQLTGTFKSTTIPAEYKALEIFLSSDKTFSRTLWVPLIQQFSFTTHTHPAISANDFFKVNSPDDDAALLEKKNTIENLREASIKYVIIPDDTQGNIFLTDHVYDAIIYRRVIQEMDSIKRLKRVSGFGKVVVYEVPSPKEHFWSTDTAMKIHETYLNQTANTLSVSGAKKGDRLIFSESYDPGWYAHIGGEKRMSKPYENTFNSFILPQDGAYSIRILYAPQSYVYLGELMSIVSGIVAVLLFILFKKKHSNY